MYDGISLRGPIDDLRGYSWMKLRADVHAGFNVALLAVPQGMAYALVAGLPPVCGLLSAIFGALVAALFGSSRHVVVGPTNATSIICGAGLAQVLHAFYRDVAEPDLVIVTVQLALVLTLMIGVLQAAAGLLRLGRLTNFVSHSVIVGYITGTAIAVTVSQLFVFLGADRPDPVESIGEKAWFLATHLETVHLGTAGVGIACMGGLLAIKRWFPKLPAPAVMLGVIACIMALFAGEPAEGDHVILVGETGPIGLQAFHLRFPGIDLNVASELLPIAFAVALLSVLDTTSVGKTMSARSGQRLSTNQELFGLGLGNMTCALVGGMPSSASPARSILNLMSGAQTRFASVIGALIVGVITLLFGPLVRMIPITALASLILVAVARLVDPKQVKLCLKATRADAFVFLTTAVSCVLLTLDTAFYIGVVISITLYLQKASSPQLRQYHVADSGRLRMVGHDESCGRQSVRVINAEGEFFFGAADLFQTTLKEIAEDDRHAKVIVLRLKNARDFDATTCLALRQLHDYLVESGRALILAGVQPHVLEVLKNAGLYDEVGAENVFPYDDRRPGRSMRRSLARAQELAGEPSDEREVAEPLLGSRRISVGGEGVDIAAGMLAGR